MHYELYTTVDITSTGQYRSEVGKEHLRWKEQNFQTLLQTIGIRANVMYSKPPTVATVKGEILGFNTPKMINVWTFEFETERDFLFEVDEDPVGYLIKDFEGVPYIAGLDESVEQNYSVFVTSGKSRNIIFQKKQ
jgi:hypothetical protein